ncbi:hypothetical protein [Nannocystis radixulma]|uniref:MYXO-CTERM domain-containing protein n=1 Tax=Nannocystis radixulma TaxID=2995305 RepID=A0ABT5B054_9BACT|nr:hypothetical protein [Nannocystis radixulma]MDC0666562.1 hypothetical protein [Nannocystis radixulma]
MNFRILRRAGLLALFTGVALASARPARACSSDDLDRGLTIKTPSDPRQIAGDGVLAFDAFIRGEAPEVALARFSLYLSSETDGEMVSGEVSHRLLGTAAYGLLDDHSEIVLVWRPEAPLAPGEYVAHATLMESFPIGWSFPVVVVDAPAAPLSPPRVEDIAAAEFDHEARERVCCEQSTTSCGPRSLCLPTRVQVVPGFRVRATLEPADVERAWLWVAPWDGEEPGAPFERMNPWQTYPDARPWWSEWTVAHDIRLPEAAGERCIVVGATSLIDGSVALAPPVCGELAAAREEARTPEFAGFDGGQACISPPVYEDDGSPYPPEPAGGCRLAGSGAPPLLVLVVLVGRRRRRAG